MYDRRLQQMHGGRTVETMRLFCGRAGLEAFKTVGENICAKWSCLKGLFSSGGDAHGLSLLQPGLDGSKTHSMTPMKFTETEERILALAGGDIPDHPEPFRVIAEEAGTDEETVIELLNRLKERKVIRRFGATLRHQKAGYSHNAMVAWRVPEEREDEVGEIFASRPEISHCYVRRTYPEWTYNFYTMIHGERPGHCDEVVRELEGTTGITDNCVLNSIKELKKTSMVYFK